MRSGRYGRYIQRGEDEGKTRALRRTVPASMEADEITPELARALIAHVAAETTVTRATADSLVGAVFSAIADALARDQTVAIAGFGKFDVGSRPARTGRNPCTGEPVAIAASSPPSFKPAKALRDAVNEWQGGAGPVPALHPAGVAPAGRTGLGSCSPSPGTFVAWRRWG